MASWALGCKNCGKDFTYSQIDDTLQDFFVPLRPQLPPEGEEREGPNCKARATYKRNELTYQSELQGRVRAAGRV
jgi:hypothetical protein